MNNLAFWLVILLASLVLTWVVKVLAVRKNILDVPNERSSHSIPTPRGGGLAIVICWYGAITYLYFMNQLEAKLFFAFISGGLLAVAGVLDDIFSLAPRLRLVVQAVSSSLALFFLGGFNIDFHVSELPMVTPAINIIIVIGMVWFINLYNFLDGIDAYAAMEAIFISLVFFLFTGASLSLVMLLAVLGFLYWNWPKAKIFMGDVGSTQLGFILIVSGIYFHNTHQFHFTYWLILTALFWFDATYTLYRRWRNKEKLSKAHRKHAYQRLVQSGFSHLKTNLYALIVNILLFFLVFLSIKLPGYRFFALVSSIGLLSIITLIINKKAPFRKD